jgi:hypothetical protein
MSNGLNINPTGGMPAVPERAISRNIAADDGRSSDESMRKQIFRNSYQSTNTVVPSIMERPSQEEDPDRGETPSRQQMTAWAPPPNVLASDSPRTSSQENRPPGPGTYGRATSNDYTIYDGGIGTPTPANPNDPYASSSKTNGPYRAVTAEDNYFPQPYRRGGAASIRDTTETGSVKTGKYTALSNSHTPLMSGHKKSTSRPHWPDGYDANLESNNGSEETPVKQRPQRRATSIYLVREGGDDGSGSPPSGDILRLPLMSWLKGPIRNRAYLLLPFQIPSLQAEC